MKQRIILTREIVLDLKVNRITVHVQIVLDKIDLADKIIIHKISLVIRKSARIKRILGSKITKSLRFHRVKASHFQKYLFIQWE